MPTRLREQLDCRPRGEGSRERPRREVDYPSTHPGDEQRAGRREKGERPKVVGFRTGVVIGNVNGV